MAEFHHATLRDAACACGLLFGVAWPAGGASAQLSTLDVHFISVGQADATLVRCPANKGYVLVDAADTRYPDSSKRFRAFLEAEFKDKPKKLDVVIASHPHTDHIGSMQWVLETFEVGTYVDSGATAETRIWGSLDKLRSKLKKQGKLQYISAKKSKSAELAVCPGANVTLDVFSPWAFASKLSDANDRSVVARLGHGNISFLFVGDAHDTAENVMLEQVDDDLRKKLDVDVLKVGHHGSHTSSTTAFILAVSPQLAVISSGQKEVGTNAGYKHPRFNTIVNYANWFKSADRSKYGSAPLPKGKVWAYDSSKKWRQSQRPDGMWLTTVDGTIVVKSNGAKLDLTLQ